MIGGIRLKILIAASEMVPFAKTGGLADVVGSLPKALHRLGHDVRVVIPNYKQISHARYLTDLPVPMDGHLETAIIRETSVPVGDSEYRSTWSITTSIFIVITCTVTVTGNRFNFSRAYWPCFPTCISSQM